MEHRWGERVGVDIPVRITVHPFAVRNGRLSNLSVSGACIKTDFDLRVLSRIQVAIDLPQRSKHEAPSVAAYVARKLKDTIGIEWCEFAPPAVSRLLQAFAARPYIRLRKPDPYATVAVSRLSAPLLKHGS
jgi:PilZ domain-containing protein